MAFHPRDIGSLLVGCAQGAAIFSFQQNKAVKFFQYDSPSNRPGGSARLTQALWHPTGTFVLAGFDDSSLVIWDVKDGRQVNARTVDGSSSNDQTSVAGSSKGTFAVREPLFKITWCAKENPDDTGILIAGGRPTTELDKGLTFLDLGPTPVYATSSWQALSDHFSKPKRHHVLPTPPNAEIIDFCLIPRKSPYFAGASDPIAVLVLLASGEMVTLSFPSGHPITPTNQLHVTLTYVHPFIDHIAMGYVDRTRWLGMVENRNRGPTVLKGGAEAKKSTMRYAHRNILQTAHADGTIRVYDVGHGDEIENEDVLQVDIARAIGRYENVDITSMSISGATAELAVGLRSGEVAIFRWGRNRDFGRDLPHKESRGFGLETIVDRAEPTVKEGLLPLSLLDGQNGPVTALRMSDVGFLCAGFEGGSITVIDLRGPAVIYELSFSEVNNHSGKRSSFRKSGAGNNQTEAEWPTIIEFGVMSLDAESKSSHRKACHKTDSGLDFSSILLHVGTTMGRLMTFKLLPETSGGYVVKLAGTCFLDEKIISISPINIDTGEPAGATPDAVAGLRNGLRINGTVLAVTSSGARIFRPPSAKGAHKTWDSFLCYKASVCRFEAHTYVLVGLFGDGTAKAFSIPGLKEITSIDVSRTLDVRKISKAIITPTGMIFGWTGPSEIAALNIFGTGQDLYDLCNLLSMRQN